MRRLLIAVALAGAGTVAATEAMAAQGCGPGFHRTYRGRCIPNRGYVRPAAVVAPGLVLRIGGFYPGRGYWNGRRYYRTRYRYGNGWRYR
jgi:hypothetical protein